jgi:hypothetical protein
LSRRVVNRGGSARAFKTHPFQNKKGNENKNE